MTTNKQISQRRRLKSGKGFYMSKPVRRKTNDGLRWAIVFLFLIVLAGGLIATVVKLNGSIKTKEIGSSAYAVGTLNTTTGKYEENASSIYTKDFITVDGLTVKVKENANVSYKLFFYNKDQEFISATEKLTADMNSTSVVSNAKYFKIVITPNADPKLSFFDVAKYAERVSVTVNK